MFISSVNQEDKESLLFFIFNLNTKTLLILLGFPIFVAFLVL